MTKCTLYSMRNCTLYSDTRDLWREIHRSTFGLRHWLRREIHLISSGAERVRTTNAYSGPEAKGSPFNDLKSPRGTASQGLWPVAPLTNASLLGHRVNAASEACATFSADLNPFDGTAIPLMHPEKSSQKAKRKTCESARCVSNDIPDEERKENSSAGTMRAWERKRFAWNGPAVRSD